MKPIQRFKLAPHEGPYEDWGGVSHLIIDGNITQLTVPGYNLLHQFEVGDGFLLLLDFDCPFEESVVAARLDTAFKLITENHFGFMYTSWDLVDIAIESPWIIDLYFGGGPKDWYRLHLIEGEHRTEEAPIEKT